MPGEVDDSALDLAAARVALVAFFGTVPSYETVSMDRVRVAPDAAILTLEQATRLLASMPKPLVCLAENVGGTLQVSSFNISSTLAATATLASPRAGTDKLQWCRLPPRDAGVSTTSTNS